MISLNVRLIRQILPVLIGSLLMVSFGMMVGWPSVAFPELVDPEISPIPITWDASAVLAGTLMIGYIVGTAFSTITIYGSKTGIMLSLCCLIAGWMVLFCAEEIIEIGISRILVGLGNGFGSQQLRNYAQGSCNAGVFQSIILYLPLTVNVGIILVYSVGALVTFRVLSLVCVAVPILALMLFGAIPRNVANSDTRNDVQQITTIYQGEKSLENNQINEKNKSVNNFESNQIGFIGAVKEKKIRNNLFWLLFLVTIPQYTGCTANIVYSQVTYMLAYNCYPKLCSVIYAVIFLFSNIAALTYTKRYCRRPVLLGSCIICSVLLSLVSCYYYFISTLLEISTIFTWCPLILFLLYNFVHTMGLNIIPILFISDKFPENAKLIASKFYIMYSSLSGLISTKIFQVLFTYHGMHMAYVYLSAVGIVSALIIFFFVNESKQSEKQEADGYASGNESIIWTTLNNPENLTERCRTVTSQNGNCDSQSVL